MLRDLLQIRVFQCTMKNTSGGNLHSFDNARDSYSGLYAKSSDHMHAAGDEAVALVSSSCAQGGVEQAIAFQNDHILPCCNSFRIRAPTCFAEFSPSQGIIESACSSWLDSGCTPGSLGVEYLSEN